MRRERISCPPPGHSRKKGIPMDELENTKRDFAVKEIGN
jgi:hypothetical protein